MKSLFSDIMPFILIEINWYVGGIYCHHSQDRKVQYHRLPCLRNLTRSVLYFLQQMSFFVRSHIKEVLMKIQDFWDIMSCQLVNSYFHFKGVYCLSLQHQVVQNYQSTEHNIPEGWNFWMLIICHLTII